jgi:hypothetical protein
LGNLGFSLGRNDEVRLFDRNGLMVDDVDYNSQAPWPVIGDNEFYSMVLKNPNYDNSLPESWVKSAQQGGNPQTYIKETESDGHYSAPEGNIMQDFIIYPNPCTDNNISIGFSLLHKADLTISLFNILGEKIDMPANNVHLGEGIQTLNYDIASIPGGMYCLMIRLSGRDFADQVYTAKIVRVR